MADALRIYRRSELEAIRPTSDSTGCLFRFHKIWVEGVDDTSDPALVGIGFAAIQHRYILLLLDNRVQQDFELSKAAFVEGVAAAQTPSRLLPELRSLWEWHAESFELDLERFVAAEERGSAGDVGFSPDLVIAHPEKNELEIIDQKSGWHPPLTEDALRGLFQARVYSRYGRDRWPGFSSYKFTLDAVRFRKKTSVIFTHEELDKVELEVTAAIATIQEAHRTNQWPATPGPSCHFCQLDCPIASNPIAIPVRLDRNAMAEMATWLIVAEKQVKSIRQLLKKAVGQYGPVTVNGVEWLNRPVETRSYPLKDLMAVLEFRGGMGAFEEEGMTLSHSALKKVFKRVPQLEEDLSGVVQSKTTYRFGPAQPGLPPGSEEEP